MNKHEKQQAVGEALTMMRAAIGRPRWKAMIRRRVRAAILDALRGKMAELVNIADKLEKD